MEENAHISFPTLGGSQVTAMYKWRGHGVAVSPAESQKVPKTSRCLG